MAIAASGAGRSQRGGGMDQESLPQSDAPPQPARRPRRRGLIVLALLLAVAGVWIYFKWPRALPSYIMLPQGHGPVQVESWAVFGFGVHRQFYIQTEVNRPWRSVLQDLKIAHEQQLTEARGAGVDEFIDLVKPDRSGRFVGVDDREQLDALNDRWSEAQRVARPMFHGDFGETVPDSFVVLSVRGPEDHMEGRYQHHALFYRITVLASDRTRVEVWDNKSHDH